MRRILMLGLLLMCGFVVFGQTHQHGTATTGDGQFNPFLAADKRAGFYLVFVQRINNVCNVMLRHSADGKVFSAPVRVNDRESDATVRNE
ncbi:MAG TPA: hypothetical protein PLQ88_25655, partial [Blastocatellia bacterium]|nr:hypothetical protein [Blastocatellia bacterium]